MQAMRERTRQGLLWAPLVAAAYVVALAPYAPTRYVADSEVYAAQAANLRHLEMPSGRYPPGLATLLALGDVAGLEMWQVIKLVSIALVVLVVVAARRIGGAEAGAVAGLLCCASPWLIASGQFVMSDALAAALVVAGLIAVASGHHVLAAVAGALGVLTRLMSVIGVLALLPIGRRYVVAAAAASAVLIGGFQWAASGSPFNTGYEHGGASWSLGFTVSDDLTGDSAWLVDGTAAKASTPDGPRRDWPNGVAYPMVVLGITYAFAPPFVAAIGLWALWRRRGSAAARFASIWLVGSLAMVLPYYFQSPRFLAPAMMLVLVYTAVGIVDLVHETRWRAELVHPSSERRTAGSVGHPEPDGSTCARGAPERT